MRRTLLGSMLAIGLVFGAGPAMGDPPASPARGPACADITRVGGSLGSLDAGKVTVVPRLELASDSCRGMTYTVSIFDPTGSTLLATQSVRGGNGALIVFEEGKYSEDAVCVTFTSGAGAHIFDRLPESGCVPIELSGDPQDYWWLP